MAVPPVAAPKRKSLLRRSLKGFLALLCVLYIVVCVFFYSQQDHLAFPAPTTYAQRSPADLGLPFEDLHIPVNASEQIHAWWIPASLPSDQVLLYFHGNGYVLEQAVNGDVGALHSLGANLLMVDYRGYGSSSPGTASEKRVFQDARAAFRYLISQRKVPTHDIISVGRSIGTGPATEIAKEHPEAGGLILISPFTSTTDIAKTMWYLAPLPLRLISHNKLDNLAKIDAVHVPLFITVGSEDRLTPAAMAQALLEKANQPKRLYLSPGADHDGIFKIGEQDLEAQMSAFLQTLH
jgi:fermentation-respiration switch protein FrsA (DUF1100 family)